ncbi:predicted protein [Postia placenta Mad-698-R]|uniref:HNH nuclease domain-containing protein n=1 Tax=Postia placenta MAD-698-R-SB12 TaxID=670580 RepID=A0A1X6N566_9APHY|nr:hypothetical protein POSPLADRAFT_1139029 [Postia placenta MAD-698-R-SB12]EED84975.1 predicted protein [Postia placenta Mad-698-R]OSX63626.1 hypothetical protein POSPLADRAFT_1139029 [Postia placenta MAD-698-R-SB12]
MVDSLELRRSDRLKDLDPVSYDECSVSGSQPESEPKPAYGKRKREISDDGSDYRPSREGTPVNDTPKTPKRRVSRKSGITNGARQRAVKASRNGGACIISGLKDKSVQQCHVLPRATDARILTSLEWWWGIKKEGLNVDSSRNMAFRASSFSEACRYARAYLHTVRGDLHILWDRGDILIAPMPDVVDAYVEKYKDGERHDILEVIGKKKIHWYCVIPHPSLSGGARSRAKRAIRQGFTNGFHKLNFVPSHARPHFMIVNAAMKIMENKELWVRCLEEFYERIHLKIDASRFAENLLTLNALWTAPPPGEAQLRRKQAYMLPMNIPTGVQRTPERSKDRKPEARNSNGEPYVNTLKSQVAQLAPTGPRCLLTHQDDKSIQGCHVIPRGTNGNLRRRLAAWWGLEDFDIDTPFNLFLLRADLHSLWDKGHIIFVPEPQIVAEYPIRSIVPIDVGMPLDEPFRVCEGPLYRYCAIGHRDLPRTEEDSAFPRALDTISWVFSRVPPGFVIYNVGLALSKGNGPGSFETALDAFYKEHNIEYEAINVLTGIKEIYNQLLEGMPHHGSMDSTTEEAVSMDSDTEEACWTDSTTEEVFSMDPAAEELFGTDLATEEACRTDSATEKAFSWDPATEAAVWMDSDTEEACWTDSTTEEVFSWDPAAEEAFWLD